MGHADPNSGNGTERHLGQVPRFIRLNTPAGHVEIPWNLWTGPTGLRAKAEDQSLFDQWFATGPMATFKPYPDSRTYSAFYADLSAELRRSLRIDAWGINGVVPPWDPGGI